MNNYFDTEATALDVAYGRAVAEGAEIDLVEWDRFISGFGPINYGESKRGSVLLFKWKGKLNYKRALTVILYRMESGKYELTSYIN